MRRQVSGRVWPRIRSNKVALAGGIVILITVVLALLAPFVAPFDPSLIDVKKILMPPSATHWLGTDALGRDVLSRMIWGGRISLLVGLISVGISLTFGIVLGAVAGYYGKIVDNVIMRLVDVMLAVPTFFLILAVISILGPSLVNVMAVIGLTSWMGIARLVRGQFLSVKKMDYVASARSLGAGDFRIITKYILPNSLSPVYVSAVLGVANAILIESSLSFLGLGVQPPTPSWGSILTAGKDNIEIAWWLSLFPGLAILITVLGYYMLGEGLQDAFNPRIQD